MARGDESQDDGGLLRSGDGGLLGSNDSGPNDSGPGPGNPGPGNPGRGNEDENEGGSFLENVGETVGGAAGGLSGFGAAGAATFGIGAIPGAMAGKEVGESVGGAVGGALQDAGDAVGGWAKDNAGHIADASLTVATGGAYLLVDGATGGFSEVQKNAEEAEQAAEKRKKKFDEAGKNLEGNGSVDTSDELLDDGKHGLEFFAKFLPIYRDWTGGGPDYEGEIVKEYDQLREIDFGAFREDARRLEGVQGVLLDQTDTMNQAFQSAKHTWKGEAADAAGAKVGTLTGGGTTLSNETEALAGAIPPAVDGIQQAVREYSKFVLDLGKDLKCADKSPEEAKDEVRKARGELTMSDLGDVGIDDIFSGAWTIVKDAAIGFILGGPIGGALGQIAGAADAAGEIRKGLIDDAKKWLDTAFKPEFDTKLDQFQQQSTGTQDTVQQAYDQLLDKTKLTDDPFAGLGEGGNGSNDESSGEDQAQSSDSSATQAGSDTGGGGGDGADTGGGGGADIGGGGGAPGGGTSGGGGTSVPGQGDEASGPGGSDDGGSGQPGGGDPKQPGGEPDTVTLGEGENEVTVAEPNDKGSTEVTVIGEDGEPKTYEVAFGSESGSPARTGEGDPGQPGEQTGAGQGDPSQGSGRSSAPGAESGPPQGRDGNERITPGEDGKAVIREGDRTITLERGADGELQVSIDNGDGRPPIEQTVEFGEDSGPGKHAPGSPEPDSGSAQPEVPRSDPGTDTGSHPGSAPADSGGPGVPGQDIPGGAQPVGGVPGGEDRAEVSGGVGAAASAAQPMGSEVPQSGVAAGPLPGAPTAGESAAGESAAGAPSGGGSPVGSTPIGSSPTSMSADDLDVDGPASTTSQAAEYTSIGRLGPDGDFTPWANGSFASMSGQLGDDSDGTAQNPHGQDRQGQIPHDQFDQARNEPRPMPGIASMQDAGESSSQGSTGIASMGDSGGSGSGDQRSGGGSGGGSGGMMGMGGMGGGQQGGGDQERTSQWRTTGQLFDEPSAPSGLFGLSSDQDEAR